MDELVLEAAPRTAMGKKNRALRAKGIIPIHVYGLKDAPLALQSDIRILTNVVRSAGRTSPVIVQSPEGDSDVTLVREVATHPVSGDLLHVDFPAGRPEPDSRSASAGSLAQSRHRARNSRWCGIRHSRRVRNRTWRLARANIPAISSKPTASCWNRLTMRSWPPIWNVACWSHASRRSGRAHRLDTTASGHRRRPRRRR